MRRRWVHGVAVLGVGLIVIKCVGGGSSAGVRHQGWEEQGHAGGGEEKGWVGEAERSEASGDGT